MSDQETRNHYLPGIVILTDEASQHVYEQMMATKLFNRLDDPLRYGIGFINASEENTIAQCWLLSEAGNRIQLPFDDAIVHMLSLVRQRENLQHIRDAGYAVVDLSLQIFIVGSVYTPLLDVILRQIRERLRDINERVDISYFLLCHKLPDGHKTTGSHMQLQTIISKLAQQKGLTFCYLYGDMRGSSLQEEDIDYTAAEALFVLIATGITSQIEFKQAIQLHTDDGRYVYGTLSTCLVTSLQEQETALAYGGAHMARSLVSEWLSEINRSHADTQEEVVERTGVEAAKLEKLERWISGQEKHPASHLAGISMWWSKVMRKNVALDQVPETILWPHQDLSKENRQGTIQSLRIQTYQLLELTSFNKIQRIRKGNQTWIEVAHNQYIKAKEQQEQWQDTASKAWQEAVEEVFRQIEEEARLLWSNGNGFAATVAYIDACDNMLQGLEKQLPATSDDEHIPDVSTDQSGRTYLETEVEYYEKMSHRFAREQEYVPSGRLLLWLGGVTVPVIILALGGVFSSQQSEALLPILLIIGIVSLGFALCGRLFFLWQHKRIVPLYMETLNFHRKVTTRYYKNQENVLRQRAINVLRARIACLTSSFLKDMERSFDQATSQAVEALFKSAPASRDIFLWGDKYTAQNVESAMQIFHELAEEMSKNIDAATQLAFHEKSREKLYRLFSRHSTGWAASAEEFPDRQQATAEQFRREFDALGRDAIDGVLKKKLQEHIRLMPYSGELWKNVSARMQTPQSNTQLAMQSPPLVFLHGNSSNVRWAKRCMKDTQQESAEVQMVDVELPARRSVSSEWVLTATLFCQHGSRTEDDPSPTTQASDADRASLDADQDLIEDENR